MFSSLGTVFSTLNSLSIGSVRLSYVFAFLIGVPVLAKLLIKK